MTDFLDVPGGRIAYDVTGSGPLVVLSHGIGVRRQDYRFLALALVWLAHIGLDRLLGTGLKYNDRFTRTPTSATVRTPGSQAATARGCCSAAR